MKSIHRYLLVSLILALSAGSLLITGFTYVHAAEEIDELYDRNMMEIAATLKSQMDALKLGNTHVKSVIGPSLSMNLKEEQDYLIQIWNQYQEPVYISHKKMTFPYQDAPGLRMVEINGQRWRTYGMNDAGFTIQISQPEHARKLFVREMAQSLLYPLLGLIPLVGTLIWLAVGRSLRPLNEISQAIMKRSATSLEPISEANIPLEVKPLVQELNELLVRLNASLEAQRRFTADAAHELRTPLTVLQLQLDNLRRTTTETGRLKHADKLQEGIDRATNVVRQMLTLARVEPNAAEPAIVPIHLDGLVQEVVAHHAAEAVEKNIDLGVLRIEPVMLHGSAENLRLLIENLVGNALRYTQAGGKINVSVYRHVSNAVLEVQDNGVGVPEAERERIFERFYRVLGNDTEGSGLGLSIAKNVVDQHHGIIEVKDGIEGKGLNFIVTLPIE